MEFLNNKKTILSDHGSKQEQQVSQLSFIIKENWAKCSLCESDIMKYYLTFLHSPPLMIRTCYGFSHLSVRDDTICGHFSQMMHEVTTSGAVD